MIILEKVLGRENLVSRFSCQYIIENNLGINGWIQGTGYTGERGVEILFLMKMLLSCGSLIENGATIGWIRARDTLRLEKDIFFQVKIFLAQFRYKPRN